MGLLFKHTNDLMLTVGIKQLSRGYAIIADALCKRFLLALFWLLLFVQFIGLNSAKGIQDFMIFLCYAVSFIISLEGKGACERESGRATEGGLSHVTLEMMSY